MKLHNKILLAYIHISTTYTASWETMSKFKPEVHITILEYNTVVYTFKLHCLKKVVLNQGKGRILKAAFRSVLIKDQVWKDA